MHRPAILAARLISSIGSIVTASAIPLSLVESRQENWIPYSVLGLALGRLFTTTVVVPRTTFLNTRTLLIMTAVLGSITAAIAGFGFHHFSLAEHPSSYILISAFAAMLSTLDDSVAHSVLGDAASNARWVHADSSLFTLCRVLGPGVAASLLIFTQNRLSIVFALDSVSYIAAAALYTLSLRKEASVRDSGAPSLKIGWRTQLEFFRSATPTWTSVGLVALGAAAYNVGIVIYLKQSGHDIGTISRFMMVQNTGMVLTSMLLVKWPSLSKHQPAGALIAALGLFLLSRSTGIWALFAGTSTMAVGMVLFLQGLRGKLSQELVSPLKKRISLATLASVNSLLGIAGSLLWLSASQLTSWANLLAGGAMTIGLAAIASTRTQSKS